MSLEDYDEYAEIMFPKTKLVNSFIVFSELDKLKIIELGISILEAISHK